MRQSPGIADRFYKNIINLEESGTDDRETLNIQQRIDTPVMDYLGQVIVDMGKEYTVERKGEEFEINPGELCYEEPFYTKSSIDETDLTGVRYKDGKENSETTLMDIHGIGEEEFKKRRTYRRDIRKLLEEFKHDYERIWKDLGHEEKKIRETSEGYKFLMEEDELQEFARKALETN